MRAVRPVRIAVDATFVPPSGKPSPTCTCAVEPHWATTVKHAEASRVDVDVHVVDGALRVRVHDDGVGGADPAGGSGLVGLRDRVEALGGTISLDSSQGEGTTLVAELPLDETVDSVQSSTAHEPRPQLWRW